MTMQATGGVAPAAPSGEKQGLFARIALGFTGWAEKWFPDSFIFAAVALVIVAAAAMANGAGPMAVSKQFGVGFWSIIPFTMQMAFVAITGYVVASSPPAARLIEKLAAVPTTGRGAVGFVALISILASMLNWGLSLVFGSLLVKALAGRKELRMDYRAAAAAAYLGLGATWALGLSSSAAQLHANPTSLPPALFKMVGVIPFTETIFLWQSIAMFVILLIISVAIAFVSAPVGGKAVTAQDMKIDVDLKTAALPPRERPGEWLEYSPLLTVIIIALSLGWMIDEFTSKSWITAISGLNTYNLVFLMLGFVLHWRPRAFLNAVAKAVPTTTGVLIQFPIYGSITAIMVSAKGFGGLSLSDQIAHFFVAISTHDTFPVVMGLYSAILGLFIPSGGGKWLLEAPYVMQAAIELKVHLGWTVNVYNAAEALPNLINPFWMLPLLGILSLKARDIVGYTFLQLVLHMPVVLFMLWFFALTLEYRPPFFP
ncbi:short-chain fatty acid transporter [Rhodoplanes azumiensis]|uniref:Short-chain fatty acid transporter n=1 Tax=Rhodoplanes azumiensis TaxID=1897628 RepID=A0ABW5AKN0_9BRAD